MKEYKIREDSKTKSIRSEDYNYNFNKENGMFVRWGKEINDDPDYCEFGPEILDIEVTTSCRGPAGKPCSFCYKSNGPSGENMSFETFKKILDKMPRTLNQCAFGADAQCESNPDIWKMMDYCRNNKRNPIVPNITVADITDETADKLAKHCGAVAVSRYEDKNICYDSVERLTKRGMEQVNIHMMISKETFDQAKETLIDYYKDRRLKDLNAIILLSLKTKGRGKHHNPLTNEQFKDLVDYAIDNNIPLGFDSCSAPKFINSIQDREGKNKYLTCVEPCESTCFSSYVGVDGKFYPCSFCENEGEWTEGLDVTNCENFVKDIWNNTKTLAFRNKLLANDRNCPVFEV